MKPAFWRMDLRAGVNTTVSRRIESGSPLNLRMRRYSGGISASLETVKGTGPRLYRRLDVRPHPSTLLDQVFLRETLPSPPSNVLVTSA